jgi:hypothetical protein
MKGKKKKTNEKFKTIIYSVGVKEENETMKKKG